MFIFNPFSSNNDQSKRFTKEINFFFFFEKVKKY